MGSERLGEDCRQEGDDETIPDDAILWRRIPPFGVDSRGQPDSSNFVDKVTGELSVVLASETTTTDLLDGHEGFGVTGFPASAVSVLRLAPENYVIRRQPLEGIPGHAVICPKLSRGDARKLRDSSEWVVRL